MINNKFRFQNSTGYPHGDIDFTFVLYPWNDFGYINVCKLTGQKLDNIGHAYASFRVLDISGNYKPQKYAYRGHILSDYADGEFESLPSELVSVFTDVEGCKTILFTMHPDERKLLIESLNVCFPDSANFNTLRKTNAFKSSVCRDKTIEDVLADMKKCQELLTCPLDICQMFQDYKR
jgi:hypothetical protein